MAGLCSAFNGTTLVRYIDDAYTVLNCQGLFIYNIRNVIFFIQIKISDESVRNDIFKEKINCVVHICSCHNMNSFKRYCGRKKDDKEPKIGKELKKLIMASCSRLMNCSNYGTIKNIFRHMCVVMLSKGSFCF